MLDISIFKHKWLWGFRVKNVILLSFFCVSIPERDLHTKKTTPNTEICPERLGAMLEYRYIKRGLLKLALFTLQEPAFTATDTCNSKFIKRLVLIFMLNVWSRLRWQKLPNFIRVRIRKIRAYNTRVHSSEISELHCMTQRHKRYNFYFQGVKTIFCEWVQRVSEILFLTQQSKPCISKNSLCNVLFIIYRQTDFSLKQL